MSRITVDIRKGDITRVKAGAMPTAPGIAGSALDNRALGCEHEGVRSIRPSAGTTEHSGALEP